MALDLNDKTSNANNLTNNGAVEVTTSLPFSQSTSAADLELGDSDYLSAADSVSLSFTGDFTIEIWVKFETLPSVAGTSMTLVSKEDGASGRSYHIGVSTANKLFCQFWDTAVNNSRFDSTNAVFSSAGVWYHVAVAFTVATPIAVIYIDSSSVSVSTVATNATSVNNSATNLFLGARPASPTDQFLDGIIDDVRIWNDVRTAGEISANYNVELAGNESNLVAYWPFEASLGLAGGAALFMAA